ncbi:MAG: hypothetical protein HRT47_01695 [Candidatus Caenarcaniphilales bacterium]|nr:hypothetical protein [Candidatus Caenarcaniphilales bacterium]
MALDTDWNHIITWMIAGASTIISLGSLSILIYVNFFKKPKIEFRLGIQFIEDSIPYNIHIGYQSDSTIGRDFFDPFITVGDRKFYSAFGERAHLSAKIGFSGISFNELRPNSPIENKMLIIENLDKAKFFYTDDKGAKRSTMIKNILDHYARFKLKDLGYLK